MNVIEQNLKGDTFAIAYQDNGTFHVSFVDNTGKELDDLNVSAPNNLALDTGSLPIFGFFQPMISVCFIENDDVFISVYHR